MLLDIEPGAEWLYPFAKNKLAALKKQCESAGISSLRKHFNVDSGETVDIATRFGKDEIRISGVAIRNGLYMAPTAQYLALKNFSVSGSASDAIPWSQRVLSVELPALASRMSFSIDTTSPSGILWTVPRMTPGRFTAMLSKMIRNDNWYARDLLKAFFLHATIVRNGAAVAVDADECIVSRPDANNNFWLLLGRFPEADLVLLAELPEVSFTGVLLQWDVFVAALSSAFVLDLDSERRITGRVGGPEIRTCVTDVSGADYTRTARGVAEIRILGAGGNYFSSVESTTMTLAVDNPSPFAVVCTKVHSLTSYLPPGVDGTGPLDVEVTRYRVNTNGSIVVDDPTRALDVGSATVFPNASGFACGLYLFEGEDFIKVGDHTETGSSSVVFTENVAFPSYAALTYVREHGLFLSNGAASRLSDGFAFANTGGGPAAQVPFGHVDFWRSAFGASERGGSDTYEGLFGSGGVVPLSPNPRALAYPVNSSGVYWHRPGKELGVFLFHVEPVDATERAIDVAKYRHVFNKDEGYRRIVQSDGSVMLEPGYEDPEAILVRIVNATVVHVNNFASPALFPWLSPTVLGVIVGVA